MIVTTTIGSVVKKIIVSNLSVIVCETRKLSTAPTSIKLGSDAHASATARAGRWRADAHTDFAALYLPIII